MLSSGYATTAAAMTTTAPVMKLKKPVLSLDEDVPEIIDGDIDCICESLEKAVVSARSGSAAADSEFLELDGKLEVD